MWQTDPMLEWTETELAGGLKLRLIAAPSGIRAIGFDARQAPAGEPNPANGMLRDAIAQLAAYFAGELREFRLALDPRGTEFQMRVWRYLETIPYGQTRSYMQIAEAIGSPRAVRAVGAANGANPIAIVIPCHRVIGANGKLVGYGGGLALKQRLLELEGAISCSLV